MSEGLRIYNLFPTLAGTTRKWAAHLPRIAAMGFNAVYVNPFHYPGFSGSLYAVKDYYRLNPRFRGGEPGDDDRLLCAFTEAARGHGLRVIMDLVVNHTSKDSELVASNPDWFTRDARGNVVSPFATDPADPTQKTVWGDLAELDYRPPQQRQILGYFQQLVRHYIGLGFGGFRCDAAYKVPAEVWRGLISDAKRADADVVFCAENLGAPKEAVLALGGAGFDYLFNSVKWWDFESPWLLEQYEDFRHIAPSIGFPESHDTDRLVNELRAAGIPEAQIEPRYRQAYAFAAAYSTGVMMPMGFEYGWSRRLDVVANPDEDPEPERFDLSQFVAEVNAMKKSIPALNEEGPLRRLSNQADPLVVLERRTESGDDRAFILVNTHEQQTSQIEIEGSSVAVAPFEVRVLRAGSTRSERPVPQHPQWQPENRIQIEEVYPELDGGRYPVKRIVGELFEVWADLFRDGHDKLRAVVKYRHEDEAWREAPLVFYDNDRWVGRFRLDAVGLWRYTIEAWTDHFESWRDEVEKKLAAGQSIDLELVEGRDIVEAALARARRRWGLYPADVARFRASRQRRPRRAASLIRSSRRNGALFDAQRCGALSTRTGGGRRPQGGELCRLVRNVPAQPRGRSPAKAPRLMIVSRASLKSRGSASMSSISFRSIRSAASTAKAETTARLRSRVIQVALMPSVRKKAVTGQSTPSSAHLPTSADSSVPPRRSGWRWRSISQSKPRPTIRGCASIRSGSVFGPTERSNTPRILPRSTKTSSMSISTTRTAKDCGPNCATRSCSGSAKACALFASTIPTPSRCRFGSG